MSFLKLVFYLIQPREGALRLEFLDFKGFFKFLVTSLMNDHLNLNAELLNFVQNTNVFFVAYKID